MNNMCPYPYIAYKTLKDGLGAWLEVLAMGNGRINVGENNLNALIDEFW